jgi:hypothetical protein
MFSDFSANGRRIHPSIPISLVSGFEGLGGDFGQDTQEIKDWITTILTPVAQAAKTYYGVQTQQAQATTQTSAASLSNISPIYLLGAGVAVYFLFFRKKGMKGTISRKR